MPFSRLIRFKDAEGATHFGDLGNDSKVLAVTGVEVEVLTGSIREGFEKSGERKKIKQVSSKGALRSLRMHGLTFASCSVPCHRCQ